MTRVVRQSPVPRGLSRTEAAAYLGIGTDIFDRGIAAGLLPQPRLLFSKRIWDVMELDKALDELPHKDETTTRDEGASQEPQNAPVSEREKWLQTVQ